MKRIVPLALAAFLLALLSADAEDITTLDHKVYKNATITRVEPDGIMVQHSTGITKIQFEDLEEPLRRRFNYDPEKAKDFSAKLAQQQRQAAEERQAAVEKSRQEETRIEVRRERERQQEHLDAEAAAYLTNYRISATVTPFHFGERQTTAWIQIYVKKENGWHNEGLNVVPTLTWFKEGERFIGVLEEPMPQAFEQGETAVVNLYKLGHTKDSSRHPLFTTDKIKAFRILTGRD